MDINLNIGIESIGSPAIVAYALVLETENHRKEIADIIPGYSSDNRGTLQALCKAVEMLKVPCNLIIRTNNKAFCSTYANAKELYYTGWRTRTGARVPNDDLWKTLTNLKRTKKVAFQVIEEEDPHAKDLARAKLAQNLRMEE